VIGDMGATLARRLLGLFGWRVDYCGLPAPKGVVIVYPHTSNWDFVIGLLAKWTMRMPATFVVKESLFRGLTGATLGRLMRWWGGRPVDRQQASGAVAQLVELMHREEHCWLALSPEGTRSHTTSLRSGFYQVALQLDLPVALAFIDYRRKRVGATEFMHMTGDEQRDLTALRAYYADKTARYPAKAGTIAFRARPSAH
jgi:1-acyl-sn-glycerol-3-phosphate acyltransferase